jgi:hypothetical protein
VAPSHSADSLTAALSRRQAGYECLPGGDLRAECQRIIEEFILPDRKMTLRPETRAAVRQRAEGVMDGTLESGPGRWRVFDPAVEEVITALEGSMLARFRASGYWERLERLWEMWEKCENSGIDALM